jgi:hypothetical protein
VRLGKLYFIILGVVGVGSTVRSVLPQ